MTRADKRKRHRISGITAAAKALGVTRQHLYLVLTGQRRSESLLKRYRERHAA